MKTIKTVYEEMISNLLEARNQLIKEKEENIENVEQVENIQEEPVEEVPVEPEVEHEPDLQNSENPKLTKKERIRIQSAFHKNKILGGNIKVDSKGKALQEIGKELSRCGFTLDMVTGDLILGPQGMRLLPFSRKSKNPYIEGTPIENSRISFTWENLEPLDGTVEVKKSYEIIAYLT